MANAITGRLCELSSSYSCFVQVREVHRDGSDLALSEAAGDVPHQVVRIILARPLLPGDQLRRPVLGGLPHKRRKGAADPFDLRSGVVGEHRSDYVGLLGTQGRGKRRHDRIGAQEKKRDRCARLARRVLAVARAALDAAVFLVVG